MQCHTDNYAALDFLLPYKVDFSHSQHYLGDTYERSTDPCSRCHTNEGFQKYVATGEVGVIANSSPITCWTCHAPHTNMNFNQRKGGVTTLDVTGATFDRGPANTCATCHQSREYEPAIADTARITSKRWGPHHGPQSDILIGSGIAYGFGQTIPSSHPHKNAPEGCVDCHMAATASEAMVGGHTFRVVDEDDNVNATGCAVSGCHDGADDDEMTARLEQREEEFEAELQEIRTLLLDRGWIDADDYVIVPGGPSDTDDRGALFNFRLLVDDNSHGVHNPAYIDAILSRTKAHLTGKAL